MKTLVKKDGMFPSLESKSINNFFDDFITKDLFSFVIFAIFFSSIVFFAPNLLGHPDNYIEANPLVTPPHIVPE